MLDEQSWRWMLYIVSCQTGCLRGRYSGNSVVIGTFAEKIFAHTTVCDKQALVSRAQ